MNGVSFNVNPLLKLKFIAASSFFGEPSYYRNTDENSELKKSSSGFGKSDVNTITAIPAIYKQYLAFPELCSRQNSYIYG
jgi:hypothetical protein